MNQTVRRIIGPTILLRSGNYFDFEAPWDSQFTIDDIAHGLSLTCRFGGQCSRFYSVAQHSVHVSQLVPAADAFAALMHDAPEAFIHDITKPLKGMLPEYKKIEDRVEAAIFTRFGVTLPLPASVKEADLVMLSSEQSQLMNYHDDWVDRRTPIKGVIPKMTPKQSKEFFLQRFRQLRNGR